MSKKQTSTISANPISGELLGNDALFTMEELCRSCRLDVEHVVEFVREGVLEARGRDQARWRFEFSSIRRARTAARLQRDLGVNPAGAALALELLERIAELERKLP